MTIVSSVNYENVYENDKKRTLVGRDSKETKQAQKNCSLHKHTFERRGRLK